MSIKAHIKTPPVKRPTPTRENPVLCGSVGRHHDEDNYFVVLFTSPTEGTVVFSVGTRHTHWVGFHANCWSNWDDLDDWIPLPVGSEISLKVT